MSALKSNPRVWWLPLRPTGSKGKIPCFSESIGKFDAAGTEIDGIGSLFVGGWSSLVTMLVGVKIYQVGFG